MNKISKADWLDLASRTKNKEEALGPGMWPGACCAIDGAANRAWAEKDRLAYQDAMTCWWDYEAMGRVLSALDADGQVE